MTENIKKDKLEEVAGGADKAGAPGDEAVSNEFTCPSLKCMTCGGIGQHVYGCILIKSGCFACSHSGNSNFPCPDGKRTFKF